MQTTKNTVSRLNFRLPSDIKSRIEKAALVSGLTVTDFAINALTNSADEVLEKQSNRQMSERDRDIFLEMLENPPTPNQALLDAVKKYHQNLKK